jgi:hypothetical protein
VKERPILFSAPMVRALLDGSKTQTRRVVKLQVIADEMWTGGWRIEHRAVTMAVERFNRTSGAPDGDPVICPFGQPGDRLWVRETHRPIFGQTCGLIAVDYKADPQEKWERMRDHAGAPKWTPSIHMRRDYSRIQLEIVSVRVERLQDISEADAKAEGVAPNWIGPLDKGPNGCGTEGWLGDEYQNYLHGVDGDPAYTATESFRTLWDSINGAGSWAANPFVWVVEFKRVTP